VDDLQLGRRQVQLVRRLSGLDQVLFHGSERYTSVGVRATGGLSWPG
jgi:hypothetical protein